jgi:PAS domain S-box-containing protein
VDGHQAGIVVFKVMANTDTLFLPRKAIENQIKEGYIISDRNGFYVYHPDKAKEWGMMDLLNKSHQNIREDYPDVAEHILSGKKGILHLVSGKTITYEPFFPEFGTDTEKYWIIIKRVQSLEYPVSASAWFAAATKAINTGFAISKIADAETTAYMSKIGINAKRSLQLNLFIFAFIALVFLLLIRWSRTRILNPIQNLTRITQKITEGDYSLKAEVESRDEIGLLASNFNKMTERLTSEITDRKHAKKALKESETRYRSLIESTSSIIWTTDSGGKFVAPQPSWERFTGQPWNEHKDYGWLKMLHPEDRESIGETWKQALASQSLCETGGRVWNIDLKEYCYFEATAVPIKSSDGSVREWVGIINDVTDHKQMEDALLRSEKMKSMGMITSGVAHEFNNILAIVKGFALQIKKKCGDDKKLEKRTDTIIKASNDGVEIVRRMREYTNIEMDNTDFAPADVRGLIKQAIEFTTPRWLNIAHANSINYNINADDYNEALCVMGNQSELREVLINIINNALDAMPDGGSLSYRTWGKENIVFVSISDTGTGMKKNIQEKLFDPFFTTKTGVGTGLGMSMAYGIITKHGGKIDVESEEGKGSTFTIRLPMSKETVITEDAVESEQEIKAEGLRILIVDDEQKICDLLSEYFLEEGHNVKSVNSGSVAIKLLRTESFDLVLSDLVMPEVSGHDIIKAVGMLEKKPKVGIITGWANIDSTGKEEALKADFIVKKPIDFSELTFCINNVFSKYSSYDIGIAEIDIQHADMDLLLSKLSEEGLSQDIKEENFELFRNTISSHFDFEEKWAQANNKNFDSDHSRAHNEVLDLLNKMDTQYKNNQLNMNTISLTIKKELLNHVRNHDIKLNT